MEEIISLLLPTRKRPHNLLRFYESVYTTASKPKLVEMVIYIDQDDKTYNLKEIRKAGVKVINGPRIVLSQMWNECYKRAQGPIYGHMGDDVIFRTKGWDTRVREAFEQFGDRIAFVYGDDGSPGGKDFGTHGFIHQKWIDTVGYFVPPYFSSDWNDTWLNDVSEMIKRHIYIDILTDHMHPAFHKGPMDETHEERLTRGRDDDVGAIYGSKRDERETDAGKLLDAIS